MQQANQKKIERVAEELMKKETLTFDQVKEIVGN